MNKGRVINKIARLFLLTWFVVINYIAASDDVPQVPWCDIHQGARIGEGSFGDVYGGTWRGQEVAIKVLHIRTLTPGQMQREFDEEVRVMSTCQFPRF